MAPEKLCDICLCPSQENDVQVKREFLPGSEGCRSLNEHLRLYFVQTKLLKLPEAEFLKLEVKSKGSKNKDSNNGNSSQATLYTTMCTRCEIIVNEALELYTKMATLQKKIDQLGNILLQQRAVANGNISAVKKRKYRTIASFQLASTLHLQAQKINEEETIREMLDVSLACLKGKSPKRKLRPRTVKASFPKIEYGNVICDEGDMVAAEEDKFVGNTANAVQVKVEETDFDISDHNSNADANAAIDMTLALENNQQKESLRQQKTNRQVERNIGLEYEDVPGNEDSDDDMDYEPGEDDATNTDDDDEYDDHGDSESESNFKYKGDDEEPIENDTDEQQTFAKIPSVEHLSRVLKVSKAVKIDSQCTTCGKIFVNRHSRNAHALRMHGIESHYRCPQCPDLTFSRKQLLVQHRNKVHGTVCDKCGKQLRCKRSLSTHLKLVHKMVQNAICRLCNMRFKTATLLKYHHNKAHVVNKSIITKLPPQPPQTAEEKKWVKIPCNICGRKYLSGEALDKHILCRHERKIAKVEREALQINCTFCWKSFPLEQRLAIHIMLVHPDKANNQFNFPCEQCGDQNITFQNCTQLVKHLEKNHVGIPIHKCTKCEWPFLNEDSLKTHEKVHHCVQPVVTEKRRVSRDTYPFKCWFCWDAFPDEEKFQKHLSHPRLHGNNGFKVEFYCDEESCQHHLKDPFTTVVDLNEHLETVHIDPSSLIQKCTVCSWGFVSPDMLELHKLNHVHSNKGKRQCPDCDHFSRSLKGLRKHYNIHHGKNIKLFKCPECGADFRSKEHMQQHSVQSHQVVKDDVDTCSSKIPCHQCGKLYQNVATLNAHCLNSHGHYECKDCGKVLETRNRYLKHRKAVHGYGQKYLCSVCGKELLNRFQLRTHMNTHKRKRYKCHLCHIRTKDLDKMKDHIKRKHEDPSEKKEFVCGECGKGFSRKDSLDDHVRVNHTEETWRVWSCEKCGKRFHRIGYLRNHQKGCDGPLETVFV